MTPAQRAALIQRYQDGPGILEAALVKVPSEALKFRPAPGKWTVHEVIIHCADSETNSHMRIRYLLGEDDALIVGYDQDRWANVLGYHDLPLEPAAPATADRTAVEPDRAPHRVSQLRGRAVARDLW